MHKTKVHIEYATNMIGSISFKNTNSSMPMFSSYKKQQHSEISYAMLIKVTSH